MWWPQFSPEGSTQAWLTQSPSDPSGSSRLEVQELPEPQAEGKHGTNPRAEQLQQKAALILDRSFALEEQQRN